MRQSKATTALARVRIECGLRQSEIARLLAVPSNRINNIENEKQAFSEELAADLAHITGADLGSLLGNGKIIKNRRGRRFTKADYQRRQAELRIGKRPAPHIAIQVEEQIYWAVRSILAIVEAGLRNGQYHLFSYRLKQALHHLCTETGARRYIGRQSMSGPWLEPPAAISDWPQRLQTILAEAGQPFNRTAHRAAVMANRRTFTIAAIQKLTRLGNTIPKKISAARNAKRRA